MCNDILKEVQKIDKHVDGIRKNGNSYEWAIRNSYGDLVWFPRYQASINVHKYLDALTKLGG